ncbi:TPA: hypothetical protein ACIBOF_004778, partial [Salmonella enterica subsp. diarizonae serovar 61:r:-]
PGKCVYGNVSGVRIPPSPPYSERMLLSDMRFFFICNPEYAIEYANIIRLSQDSIALLRTV